jgi:hypothetical protein
MREKNLLRRVSTDFNEQRIVEYHKTVKTR